MYKQRKIEKDKIKPKIIIDNPVNDDSNKDDNIVENPLCYGEIPSVQESDD